MGLPAARVGDKVMQTSPHCHCTIHPPSIPPTPVPHPSIPFMIIPPGAPTVLIGGMPAARVGDMTQPCTTAGCPPIGPGVITMGSTKVLIAGMPAARITDTTTHSACVAPIPGPTGMVMPPGAPKVLIG